jgi:VanZ family protein
MTKESLTRNLGFWVPVLLWMSVIFWMSTTAFSSQNTSLIIEPVLRFLDPSLSQHQVDLIHDVIRKAGHVTEYFVFGILLFRAFRGSWTEKKMWQWALLSVAVIALYAASDELHQSFVATRTPSLLDVCIDTSAGILAQAAGMLWHQWHHRHRR